MPASELAKAELLAVAAHVCMALAAATAGYALALVSPLPRPRTGTRGQARALALRSAVFAHVEPAVRWLAAMAASLAPSPLRQRAQTVCAGGGHLAGLDGDELLGLCLLAGGAAGVLGWGMGLSAGWVVSAAVVGSLLPVQQLNEKARLRREVITRALPAVIDVMALAMGAGLGFAAALDLAAREAVEPGSDLDRELRRVRQSIATGHSRRSALETLNARVASEAVRELTSAVIQGEQKGMPLSDILAVQARALRARRAVVAEEAAARASVLLAMPLLLLLAAVMLLMFGPFIIKGMGL